MRRASPLTPAPEWQKSFIIVLKIELMRKKNTLAWTFLFLTLVLFFILNVSIGSVRIPLAKVGAILLGAPGDHATWADIIWDFRMPKAITCVLAGSALSLAGLQMQTLFRNPLAGPDVLGLTSGASLAVSLVFMGGGMIVNWAGPWVVVIAASTGSGAVAIVMMLVAGRIRDNVSLLIVGLMVGAGTASVVSVLQYMSRAEEMQVYLIWTFGTLGGMSWVEIQVLAGLLIIGAALAVRNMKPLNAWLLGDQYAQSLGVSLGRSRLLIILSTVLLTGGVTAFCGPIAFVGIAVPHLVRMLIKTSNHKTAIPGVMAGGAALVLGCDIIARLPGATHVLPINAITALIGAPVVIWIVIQGRSVRV